MARRLRVSSAGVSEHLIQRGNNRQATFACEEDMQAYVGWLKTYSKKYKKINKTYMDAPVMST